jgi:signal peptidase I
MFTVFSSYRTLKRARRAYRAALSHYRRKAKRMNPLDQLRAQTILKELQAAILQKDPLRAKQIVATWHETVRLTMPKTAWDRLRDGTLALLFAVFVALLVRQTWFELYMIPTGSMRPTLKEEDLLVVSKTDFGINTLTPTGHYAFDPSLMKRGAIVIFSGAGMDIAQNDTFYFWIIPGKKQYVKRLIGKPGDILYFYGGRIYGIDSEGRELTELRKGSFQNLEHIPFLRFDGKAQLSGLVPRSPIFSVFFHQMNEPVAKLTAHASGKISGGMLKQDGPRNYSDLWGFKNFAMARLLTKEQMRLLYPNESVGSSPLYLELTHHPSLQGAVLGRDEMGRMRPLLATTKSFLPLDQKHIDELMNHMTTCRFRVKNGRAARFGASFDHPESLPQLKDVPDGMYEIQNGTAARVIWSAYPPVLSILWSGWTFKLRDHHPLLNHQPEHVQTLFNLGLEFDTHYDPSARIPNLFPSRYAYFRDGDLYVMGSPLFKKGDPVLDQFFEQEQKKTAPFIDTGPPDLETIRSHGVKVPEGAVLVLGDNHPMSADSRYFGFVPLANLRGGASFLYWPPSPRWGRLPQPSIDHFTIPNVTVWGCFLVIGGASVIYLRRKLRKPLCFE